MAINKIFVPTFFGEQYYPSINVLFWLAPQIVLIPISYSLCCAYYIPTDKINMITIFEFCTAILNVCANVVILLFTDLGAVGVAITSFCSALIMDFLTIWFSKKDVDFKPIVKKMIKPLLASVVMYFVIILFNHFVKIDNDLYIVIFDLMIGVATFGAFILLFRDELVLSFLKLIFKKIRRE